MPITRRYVPYLRDVLLALQQILSSGTTTVTIYRVSFIPEAGKHYFPASGRGVREIPRDVKITPATDAAQLFQQYDGSKVRFRNVHERCKHYIGGS